MNSVSVFQLLVLAMLIQSSLQTEETPGNYLVTPPTTYTPTSSSFTSDCNLGEIRGLRRCPNTARLTDDVTNEGMDFNSDNFMGWNSSFDLEFNFGSQNYFFTRVDIYYYNNPSGGYGLPDIRTSISLNGNEGSYTTVVCTFIDNSEVSQSDDNVQVLSLVILTPESSSSLMFLVPYQYLRLQFIFSSSFLATQTFISEMRFFTDTDTSFTALPIVFMSPNQTLQPDTIQSSLSLSCSVDNNGTFHWTWTGPGVSNGVTQAADTTRTSILMLSNVSTTDAGDYTCTASYLAFGDTVGNFFNSIKPEMQTMNNINLTLFSNVSAEIHYDELLVPAVDTVTVQEDTNVTLSCIFTGYLPVQHQINWMDNNMNTITEDITNGTNTRFSSQRGSSSTGPAVQSNYTLLSVEVDDSGSYTCSMSGTGLKETISLRVTSATVSSTPVPMTTSSTPSVSLTPTSSAPSSSSSPSPQSGVPVPIVAGAAGAGVLLVLIVIVSIFIAVFYCKRRSVSKTMVISDSSNGLYAELSKPEPPPLPSRIADNGGYASIDIPSNGFPMNDISSPLPPPLTPQHTSPDRPTPAQISSKPNFLQPNPMYASSENLDGHFQPREYLQPTRSLPHIADADEPREMGSQFNIYAKPNLAVPPPVPPYRGTPGPDDGIFTDEDINPEALKRQSFNMDSSIYGGYRAIYNDPQPLQRSENELLEVKEKNIRELKDLGMGQFGVVVLAHTVSLSLKQLGMSESNNDPGVSLVVAIKRLRSEADDKMREMFEKEVKFMARLRHENVVRLLGVCLSKNAFIMMEYMENGDLNHYLRNMDLIEDVNPLPEGAVSVPVLIYICLQVARGMCYLASLRFIHRDLATRNILVGQDFKVKIADFGMSQNLYSDFYYRIQGRAVLPIRWMANECFYGRFSEKTDVWSFGVLMWEIFTLCKLQPFDRMTDQEVIDDAIKGSERILPYQPQACPNEIYSVMLDCWTHEPEERASFEQIYDLLSSIHAYNDFS